jgi:hypothetical protein
MKSITHIVLPILLVIGIGLFLVQTAKKDTLTAAEIQKCKQEPRKISALSISYPRDNCYMDFAKKKKDPSICNRLETLEKEHCISLVAANEKSCRSIQNESYRSTCLTNLSGVTHNPSLCDENQGDDSYDLCILSSTTKSTNITDCAMRNRNGAFYAECIRNVAINTKQTSLCDLIDQVKIVNPQGNAKYKGECFAGARK